MSLVAYDSSDENSEDEEVETPNSDSRQPKILENRKNLIEISDTNQNIAHNEEEISTKIHFDKLPKPKSANITSDDMVEDDDIPSKEILQKPEKPIQKKRVPVEIMIPSLSQFKDIEEEDKKKENKVMPSEKGTGLFALLPPPKNNEQTTLKPSTLRSQQNTVNKNKLLQNKANVKTSKKQSQTVLTGLNYDSNSEDEDTVEQTNVVNPSGTDFFSLTNTETEKIDDKILEIMAKETMENENIQNSSKCVINTTQNTNDYALEENTDLENKVEVGPSLPSADYNINSDGNIALDEKAIEHLCGKRGVKRKNLVPDEANIIEINGEDIKPDEREWLVKALTEEPIQRPISMQSSGVNSQSKKKHQITYLAHQAKAMEMELKNQWAQNRMTRKQTQSKYGF